MGEKSEVQLIFDQLESEGLLMKSGKMRPGRGGDMQPVYVLTEEGWIEYRRIKAKQAAASLSKEASGSS